MRCLMVMTMLVGCSGSPTAQTPDDGRRVLPLSAFSDEPRVSAWPRVGLVPENALEFRINVADAQSPQVPVFTVFQVQGDQAIARPETLPRWKWDEAVTQAIVSPVGLQRGAPYLLVGEGMAGPNGAYATFALPFRVIPADEQAPDGSDLAVVGDVKPGGRGVLTVTFPEPMREDVVYSLTTLLNGVPQPIDWVLSDDQRRATWTPPEAWPEGVVHVSIGAGARDLAGHALRDLPPDLLTPVVRHPATDGAAGHPPAGGDP